MQSATREPRGRSGVLNTLVAVAAALAVSPAFAVAPAPAELPPTTPAEAHAKTPIPAAEPVAEGAASSPSQVTPEQVYTAMIEAEVRRAKALRPDPGVPKSIAARWGVEVLRVDNTARGFWLDFRFRVTDAEKALPLFDSRAKPYLQSDRTGAKLAVPSAAKVGALRTTNRGHNIKSGKIYSILFANPGFHVKPGEKVSVVIGDFKVEHLTVN